MAGGSDERPPPGLSPLGVHLNVMEPPSAESSPARGADRGTLSVSPTVRLQKLTSSKWNIENLNVPEDIKDILRVFDGDGDGNIDISEIKEAGDMIFAARTATKGSVSIDALPAEIRGEFEVLVFFFGAPRARTVNE